MGSTDRDARFIAASISRNVGDPRLLNSDVEGDLSALCKSLVSTAGPEAGDVLLGESEEVRAQVNEWLSFGSSTRKGSLHNSMSTYLRTVDTYLSTKAVFVGIGTTIGVGDIALFLSVHDQLAALPSEELKSYSNLLRWIDYVQHKYDTSHAFEWIPVKLPQFDPPVSSVGLDTTKVATPAQGSSEKENPAASSIGPPSEKNPKKEESKGKSEPPPTSNVDKKDDTKGTQKKEKKVPTPVQKEAFGLEILDIRVGVIESVKRHPTADTLYVEEINIGEGSLRQVASGLAKYLTEEQMLNRRVLVLVNVKPSKLREVMSAGLVLCASNEDHTQCEPVQPPKEAPVGERVIVAGFEGKPEAVLNPKKKQWEKLYPDLHTDDTGVACYQGKPLMTSAGPCSASIVKGTIKLYFPHELESDPPESWDARAGAFPNSTSESESLELVVELPLLKGCAGLLVSDSQEEIDTPVGPFLIQPRLAMCSEVVAPLPMNVEHGLSSSSEWDVVVEHVRRPNSTDDTSGLFSVTSDATIALRFVDPGTSGDFPTPKDLIWDGGEDPFPSPHDSIPPQHVLGGSHEMISLNVIQCGESSPRRLQSDEHMVEACAANHVGTMEHGVGPRKQTADEPMVEACAAYHVGIMHHAVGPLKQTAHGAESLESIDDFDNEAAHPTSLQDGFSQGMIGDVVPAIEQPSPGNLKREWGNGEHLSPGEIFHAKARPILCNSSPSIMRSQPPTHFFSGYEEIRSDLVVSKKLHQVASSYGVQAGDDLDYVVPVTQLVYETFAPESNRKYLPTEAFCDEVPEEIITRYGSSTYSPCEVTPVESLINLSQSAFEGSSDSQATSSSTDSSSMDFEVDPLETVSSSDLLQACGYGARLPLGEVESVESIHPSSFETIYSRTTEAHQTSNDGGLTLVIYEPSSVEDGALTPLESEPGTSEQITYLAYERATHEFVVCDGRTRILPSDALGLNAIASHLMSSWESYTICETES